MGALRLVIYDATQKARPPRALGLAWRAGTVLYRGLDRVDTAYGAESWSDALSFLARHQASEVIGELQFWGHGLWGRALIREESLDARALSAGHALESGLAALRERLADGALVWFRSCQIFGASAGQDFARRLSDYLGARVAGHTFVIHYFQSGLHSLAPGESPGWSNDEGISIGTPERPERAFGSAPWRPHTITCLTGSIPEGY